MNEIKEKFPEELLNKVHLVELSILKDLIKVCDKYQINWFLIFGSALGAARHKGFIPWDDDIDSAMLRDDFEKFTKIFDKELGDKYILANPLRVEEYGSTVTHMELKGTKYISKDALYSKYEPGISIDIFIFDKVSKFKLIRYLTYYKSWFLGILIYLTANENLNKTPIAERNKLVFSFCKIIQKVLLKLHIDSRKIYKKIQISATKRNSSSSEYYSTFEDRDMLNNTCKLSDIFPLKKLDFEDIQVNVMNNYDKNLTNIYGDYMAIPPEEKRYNHRPAIIEFL